MIEPKLLSLSDFECISVYNSFSELLSSDSFSYYIDYCNVGDKFKDSFDKEDDF